MDLVLQLGALCVALAAVAVVCRSVYRTLRRVDAFLEDWNGEPARAGREARPSMPERVTAVEKRLTKVEAAILNG
jgi:hypothetical protein